MHCFVVLLSGALAELPHRQVHPAQARRQRAQPLHPEQHGRAEKQAAARTHGQESGMDFILTNGNSSFPVISGGRGMLKHMLSLAPASLAIYHQ